MFRNEEKHSCYIRSEKMLQKMSSSYASGRGITSRAKGLRCCAVRNLKTEQLIGEEMVKEP